MPHRTLDQIKLRQLPGALISYEPHLAKLTPKQALFVLGYVSGGFNGSKAAEQAGYKAGNGNTFSNIGWENVRLPHVRAAIQVEVAKHVEATGWSKDSAITVIHTIMMRALQEEAFAPAIAAWVKLSDVTGVIDEMQDKSVTIQFHSREAAALDPMMKDVTPAPPASEDEDKE